MYGTRADETTAAPLDEGRQQGLLKKRRR
jgi:hypothetical protein